MWQAVVLYYIPWTRQSVVLYYKPWKARGCVILHALDKAGCCVILHTLDKAGCCVILHTLDKAGSYTSYLAEGWQLFYTLYQWLRIVASYLGTRQVVVLHTLTGGCIILHTILHTLDKTGGFIIIHTLDKAGGCVGELGAGKPEPVVLAVVALAQSALAVPFTMAHRVR